MNSNFKSLNFFNLQTEICNLHFYSTSIASNLQASKHMPHLMHLLLSILKGFPFSVFVFLLPVIAFSGQTLTHAPQHLQTSGRIRY